MRFEFTCPLPEGAKFIILYDRYYFLVLTRHKYVPRTKNVSSFVVGTYNLLCVFILYKLKVKVTPGTERSWRYSYNLFAISALEGDGRSTPLTSRLTPGKDPIPIVQETGKSSWPVWTGMEYVDRTGIRSPTFRPVVRL